LAIRLAPFIGGDEPTSQSLIPRTSTLPLSFCFFAFSSAAAI